MGVPLITQVLELIDAQAGSAGEIEQSLIAEPLLLSVVGVTDIATPMAPFVPVAPA